MGLNRETIESAREALGLSQVAFAKLIGASPQTFRKWVASETASSRVRPLPAMLFLCRLILVMKHRLGDEVTRELVHLAKIGSSNQP